MLAGTKKIGRKKIEKKETLSLWRHGHFSPKFWAPLSLLFSRGFEDWVLVGWGRKQPVSTIFLSLSLSTKHPSHPFSLIFSFFFSFFPKIIPTKHTLKHRKHLLKLKKTLEVYQVWCKHSEVYAYWSVQYAIRYIVHFQRHSPI